MIRDKRNNIFYLENGDLVYYAAALGIVHNVPSNTQKFLQKHEDDILSMAMHPDKVTVATGDQRRNSSVVIWNAITGEEIITIKNGLSKGVDNLKFSESGQYLAASCMDDDHKVLIFDCNDNYKMVAVEKGGRDFILGMVWVGDTNLVTVGIKHYKYWTLSGSSLKGAKGSFTASSNNILLCAEKANNGDILAGSAKGELQVWRGSSCGNVVKSHKGTLDAIAVSDQM